MDNFCVQENDPLFSDGHTFLEWSFRAHCISEPDKIRRNPNINYAQQWDEQKAELYKNNIDTENCYLSEAWLSGTIHPIYKGKGSPKDPSNYRPITIPSCLGKLFTAILNNRLNVFLEDNDILMHNQAGFRKDYSCSDHIFNLNCLMQALKKRKRKLFCCFIDFSQAFDKVWRNGLW